MLNRRNAHKANLSLTTISNNSFAKLKHVDSSFSNCTKPHRQQQPYKHYYSNENSFYKYKNESGNSSNSSLRQVISKTKKPKKEEASDVLDNIQINDHYEQEEFTTESEAAALNQKTKSQIVVNISTIYNKGRKLQLNKLSCKNSAKQNLPELNASAADDKEKKELNDKIKQLLEMNAKLRSEKTEIENENKILIESINKYKRCICNTNNNEYQQCKNMLTKYKTEYQLCLNTVNVLQKEQSVLLQEKDKFQKKQHPENKLKSAPIKFTTFKKQTTITIDPDAI